MVESEYMGLQQRLLQSNRSGVPEHIQKAVRRAYALDPNFRKQYKAKFKNNGIYSTNARTIEYWLKSLYTWQDYLELLK